ncbi:MAG: uS2 family ribosomal protein [Mycoplasmoidaceae bacterium]|nr:uS2 family ribosomal protein [Mycoplasmoidaceae bacterium]
MRPFIYPGKGGKNQIIDILKTIIFLDRAYNFLRDITKEGGRILFVGTRGDYVKNLIKNECTRSKSFYINQR